MLTLIRLVGVWFLLLAMVAAVIDATKSLAGGGAWVVTPMGEQWKALNKEAMQNVWAIPTLFGRSQSIAGSKVHSASGDNGNVYFWAPFTSWPYPDMYVTQ